MNGGRRFFCARDGIPEIRSRIGVVVDTCDIVSKQ